jgi:hypothetical protein
VTITSGLSEANGIVVDPGGDVIVSNFNPTFNVTLYSRPYTGGPTIITNGINDPYRLAMDSFGNLFVNNTFTNTVTEYAPPYTGSPIATIATGIRFCTAMIVDGAGNLFLGGGSNVLIYAPPYTSPPTSITNGASSPAGLALDGASDLFVTNNANNTVTEYAPPYTGAPLVTISNGLAGPYAIAVDKGGNVFVSNTFPTSSVTEYAPPYTGSPIATITSGINEPSALLLTP